MAGVVLTELWLHDVNDYSSYQRFGYSQVSGAGESENRVMKMASGRLVNVRTPGVRKTWNVGLRYANRADAEWLDLRTGDTFLVRTAHGAVFYAVLNNVNGAEELLTGSPHLTKVGSVNFTLTEVTISEAV